MPFTSCVRQGFHLDDASVMSDASPHDTLLFDASLDAPPVDAPPVDLIPADTTDDAPALPPPLIGELDPSFAQQGQLTLQRGTDTNICTYGLATEADGTFYIQGRRYTGNGYANFITARLLADGSLDENFGSAGYVLEAGSPYSYGYGVVLRPSGGLFLIGDHSGGATRKDDVLVFALLKNGFRDLTFNSTGAVTADFGNTEDTAQVAALDSQGRLVVCGIAGYNLATANFMLLRFTPDGKTDTEFGVNGRVRLDGGGMAACVGVIALSNDEIVAVGHSKATTDVNNNGFFVHLAPDGSSLFSDGSAYRTYPHAGGLALRAVEAADDGSLIAVGGFGGTPPSMALLRLDGDGGLVSDFGEGGTLKINIGGNDSAKALSLAPDGRIVIGGSSDREGSKDFAFARVTAAGQLDVSFGQGGSLVVDFSGGADSLGAIAHLEDGRLLAMGYTDDGTIKKPAVLRLR